MPYPLQKIFLDNYLTIWYNYINGENMPSYLIAQVNIINEKPYKEYLKQTTPLVKKYNGELRTS